jgi:hypothetical protein
MSAVNELSYRYFAGYAKRGEAIEDGARIYSAITGNDDGDLSVKPVCLAAHSKYRQPSP